MSTQGRPAELDAERAARVLLRRGSVRESVALLRGAVARDREEEGCAGLLEKVLEGEIPTGSGEDPPLDLALVDRWIRRGMLVEALALLGGTPLGSDERGHEWADLLGELLAPVPFDAEETLVEMHRHLLTGGASVALVLLEERTRREPALPAWADRRLELLRWMLLDNAGTAESHPPIASDAPTALAAAVQDALQRVDLEAAREVARSFAERDPDDPDAPALVLAMDTILAELERRSDDMSAHARTLPMFGHTAACMQLRMGNLAAACSVYRKMLRKADDDDARRMLDAVESVLRATRGEPVVERDPWSSDTDRGVDSRPEIDFDALVTSVAGRAPPERSGPLPVLLLPPELAYLDDDAELTVRSPNAATQAEHLLAEGLLDEAERLYQSLSAADPSDPRWIERLEHVRALREGETSGVVLVRAIRTVE